jgi:transcriptional regulator with XRE-family HTH domain
MPTSLQVALGRTVKALRNKAGQSQDALAAAAKVHRTYIPQLESGRINVTIRSLEKVAHALGLTAGELLIAAEKER